jgi:hypothetical protein
MRGNIRIPVASEISVVVIAHRFNSCDELTVRQQLQIENKWGETFKVSCFT